MLRTAVYSDHAAENAEAFNKLNRASVHKDMVCVVMVDSRGVALRDVDLQADRACQHDKTVRVCLHISEFVREEAYVVREIKVLQMSGKAPYNISFMQGQLAHDVVQNNCEEKRRQRAALPYSCVCDEGVAYFAILQHC